MEGGAEPLGIYKIVTLGRGDGGGKRDFCREISVYIMFTFSEAISYMTYQFLVYW